MTRVTFNLIIHGTNIAGFQDQLILKLIISTFTNTNLDILLITNITDSQVSISLNTPAV